MPVWEYEIFLKEINRLVKEENERNKQEQEGKGYKDIQRMSNPNYIKNMSNNYMNSNKMPSMPKMPKL